MGDMGKIKNVHKISLQNAWSQVCTVEVYSSIGLHCKQHTSTTALRIFCFCVMIGYLFYCLLQTSGYPVDYECVSWTGMSNLIPIQFVTLGGLLSQ
jgi:hypothetical protein